MRDSSSMWQILFIGIAAGAASALLLTTLASGLLLSAILSNLAALPILIAALGWSHLAGLVAVVVATAALAFIFPGYLFLAFLVGIGLPAWWLGYLTLLARPSATAGVESLEWYPVGRIGVWAAMLGVLSVAGVVVRSRFHTER